MTADDRFDYLEYQITIVSEGDRFVARVGRAGGLIEHDGRACEVWLSASCVSQERAIWTAKRAIDTDEIR